MPHLRCSNSVLAVTLLIGWAYALPGCGTTRSSDTIRTATEQLLISDAIDRAVQSFNCSVLAGQSVYLDDSRLGKVVDREYLVSTLRQHLLASGCILRDRREDADFIVEARVGAIGTDRNDLLFGIPATNVPQILPAQPTPTAIPEVPLAKRRDQRGVVKIAMFAYHRETGTPVWQSGVANVESSSNDVWIFGAGPFRRGTIYAGSDLAGEPTDEANSRRRSRRARERSVDLATETLFTPPDQIASQPVRLPPAEREVVQASYEESPRAQSAAMRAAAEPDGSQPAAPLLRKPPLIQSASSTEMPQSNSTPGQALPQPRFDSP